MRPPRARPVRELRTEPRPDRPGPGTLLGVKRTAPVLRLATALAFVAGCAVDHPPAPSDPVPTALGPRLQDPQHVAPSPEPGLGSLAPVTPANPDVESEPDLPTSPLPAPENACPEGEPPDGWFADVSSCAGMPYWPAARAGSGWHDTWRGRPAQPSARWSSSLSNTASRPALHVLPPATATHRSTRAAHASPGAQWPPHGSCLRQEPSRHRRFFGQSASALQRSGRHSPRTHEVPGAPHGADAEHIRRGRHRPLRQRSPRQQSVCPLHGTSPTHTPDAPQW